jgi:hypothetical protein
MDEDQLIEFVTPVDEQVMIQNTFIAVGIKEIQSPRVSKSCPASPLFSKFHTDKAQDVSYLTFNFVDCDLKDRSETPSTSSKPDTASIHDLIGCESDATVSACVSCCGDSQQSEQIVNDHSEKRCRPCAFFAKGMCNNGNDCEYCHEEHSAEYVKFSMKRNRKQRLAKLYGNKAKC